MAFPGAGAGPDHPIIIASPGRCGKFPTAVPRGGLTSPPL